ncbi:MAG: pyruvate kinase [Verrucomicrobiae bacterium]|jgi:pyruvate kinase|nr:pyruvate kinase [Verrucomicrobiae bacterium]
MFPPAMQEREPFRRTKIIATLGPATESPDMLRQLITAGVNVARINMSHAPHDWVRKLVADIRAVAKELDSHVGILMDTQGPAIRTGDLPVPLDLKPGQKFTLTVRGETSEEEHSVDVNYANFVNDINIGDVVLLDNGEIHMKVLAKKANHVDCEVLTPGTLKSRRHINLPGVKVSLPALTSKDLDDVALGLELKVDFVALSFCREAKDLRQLRAVLSKSKNPPKIVAKIEDQEAVRNLDDIVNEADAVMVARGDLGIECPYEDLPMIQRRIVKACLQKGCPVIVATHMLESMIDCPMPTRAEITDVANAVFEQADAIMLSGETTVGKYPVKCIEVFDRIAKRTERSGGANFHEEAKLEIPREKLARSAVVMADELQADGIIVFTREGHMAGRVSWLRPRHTPIFAVCDTEQVANSMSLLRGVTPIVIHFEDQVPSNNIAAAVGQLKEKSLLKEGNTVVVVGSIISAGQRVHAVQMRKIE